MAKARTKPEDAAEARAVEGTPEAQEQAREGEAERQAEQVKALEQAEERRQREAEKAAGLKSAHPEAEAPPSQKGQGDGAQYSTQRLIDSAQDFLGYPSHVAAGAFAGSTTEYMTVEDAKGAIEDWLGTPVEYARAEEA